MKETPSYVDSHAHLCDPLLYPSVKEILKKAAAVGVELIVNVCTDLTTLNNGLLLAKETNSIINIAGGHPHDAAEEEKPYLELIKRCAHEKTIRAIGEIGLDYHYKEPSQALQKKRLEHQIGLALESNLPLVFHCREAFDDLFGITDTLYKKNSAILHCFTGSLDEAKKVLDRGWLISFSGILTFKKSEELRSIAKELPLESIVIETDAPFLSPQGRRGETNEPSFIEETAACLAMIKKIPLLEVAKQTTKNAKKFFSIP